MSESDTYPETKPGWFARRISASPEEQYNSAMRLKIILDWLRFVLLFLVPIAWLVGGFYFLFVLVEGSSQTNTNLDNLTDPNTMTKTLLEDGTQSFFDSIVFVSVLYVGPDRSTFSVGSPGYQNVTATDAKVGHRMVFNYGTRYEVRLTSVGSGGPQSRADFTVVKLDDSGAL